MRTGTMLAGYRFDSLIGEGATGAVHLAEDTKHELRVTVKAYKLPAARGVQKLDPSCRGALVFVDEAAEQVAAAHLKSPRRRLRSEA